MERWLEHPGWNVPREVDVSRGLTGAYLSFLFISNVAYANTQQVFHNFFNLFHIHHFSYEQ